MINFIPGSIKLFNMSDDLYFGDGLPKDYISNSKMGLINPVEGGSVRKFSQGFAETKSEALKLGSAVHQLVLEREKYELADVNVPGDGPRNIINTVYKLTTRSDNPLTFDEAMKLAIQLHNYYKGNPGEKRTASLIESTAAYYRFLCNNDTENMIFLPDGLKDRCINAIAAIDANPDIEPLMNPRVSMETGGDDTEAYNEYVITAAIIHNGNKHHLKMKADNITVNHTRKLVRLNDLKTSSYKIDSFMGLESFGLNGFTFEKVSIQGSFQKYHYYRQMYMYLSMLKQWVTETYGADYTFECNMIVVETGSYKPVAKVFEVSDYWLEVGQKEFNYLMDLIDQHYNGESNSELSDLEIDFDAEEDSLDSLGEDDLDDLGED